MAYATSTYVAMAAMAAAAAASAYNTNQTAKRQDGAAADAIMAQSAKQRQADARINEEVAKLQNSTSSDETAKRMADYSAMLRRNKAVQGGGLTGVGGGLTFQRDAAAANDDVQREGMNTAELMARIDAPGMQRAGEAFGFGHLASDIDLVKRESAGQSFLDDLRMRSIRRNPWIDLGAGLLSSFGSAGMGGAGMGSGSTGSTLGPLASGYSMPFGGAGSSIPSQYTSYGLKLPNFGG